MAWAQGRVVAWGDNSRGQTNVPGDLTNVVAISAGGWHSLVQRADSSVVSWGFNDSGQTNVPRSLTNVVQVSAGGLHSMALRADGTVAVWGDYYPEVTNVPSGLGHVIAIAAGWSHCLALRSDASVVAWGGHWDGWGYIPMTMPAALTNIAAIAGGVSHSLALRSDGTAVAWGLNSYGQTDVPAEATNIVAIAAGAFHCLALRADGSLIGWGRWWDGTNVVRPTIPTSLTNCVAVSSGWHHGLALRTNGSMFSWGQVFVTNDFVPEIFPAGLTNAGDVSGGGTFSLALLRDSPPFRVAPLVHRAVAVGGTVFFRATAASARPLWCQWSRTGSGGLGTNTWLTLTNVQPSQAGQYSVTLRTTSNTFMTGRAQLSVVPALITAPLQDQTVVAGDATIFTVEVQAYAPSTYQWRLDGTHLPGATNASLVLTAVRPDHAGAYSVTVSNVHGAVTSGDARLFVIPFRVTSWPSNQVVLAGETVTFALGLQASVPLHLQWRFNDTDLTEATNAVLVLTNVRPAQAGEYSVTVSAAFGDTSQASAQLAVLPLVLTSQPSNQVAHVGGTVAFMIGVDSELPLSYQWRRAGADLPGATNATLILTNVQLDEDGSVYSVVFSNEFITVTSSNATLSVGWVCVWDSSRSWVLGGLTNPVVIAAGLSHALALQRDGTIVGRGDDTYGQATMPAGLTNVIALAAGSSHSMALQADGVVAAWGRYWTGRSNAPMSVPVGLSNVVAIASGWSHALALRAHRTVAAWGQDAYGQASVPTGLSNVVAVAGGGAHSLALRADGTVVAWGYSGHGRTEVPNDLTNAIAIAAGGTHSLALRAEGTVVAWGYDGEGQSTVPTGLSNVVAIAGGDTHSLALCADGRVVTWGDSASVPTGLTNVALIAAGGRNRLGLTANGSPFFTRPVFGQTVLAGATAVLGASVVGAWPLSFQWQCNGTNVPGATNAWLALTDLQPTQSGDYAVVVRNALGVVTSPGAHLTVLPVQITAQPQARVVFAGAGVTFTVDAVANAPWTYQWRVNGANLPDATNATLALSGVRLDQAGSYSVALSNVFGVVVSAEAVLSVNNVAAWGYGWYGEATVPGGMTTIVSMAAGGGHNLALRADGTPVGWGYNNWGQANAPVASGRLAAVSAGPDHSLALQEDGKVLGWGQNRDGQCNVPAGLTNAAAIAADGLHSLALRANGTVAAWGANANGQTGVPPNLTNVVGIAASYLGGLALRANGTVVGWGASWDSQTRDTAGLTSVVAVAAGYDHALALRADGAIVVWGQTNRGQADIPAGLSNVVAISAGNYYSLALQSDGAVVAWGANDSGQINVPVDLTNVVAISGGSLHGLALIGDGAPVLTLPLVDRTVLAGDTACFSATASGTWPLHFQWRCNGTNVPGATSRFLVLNNVLPEQAGTYSVSVSNAVGVTNSREARLDVPPLLIAGQPQSRTLLASESATFTVVGQSVVPWTAQWRRNGADLPEATNAVLTLTNLQVAQSGTYSVFLSNVFGAVTSAPAVLTVLPVRITAQPQNRGGFLGGSAVMWVSAEGPAPWTCQWKFNGTNLPGATNASLAFTNLDSTHAGRYSAMLSNVFGEISSVDAILSVGWVAGWGRVFTAQNAVLANETNLVAIAAGGDYSLGIRPDGTVTGWGTPSWLHTNLPPDLTNVIAVADSDFNSLSLRADGTVVAWGELRNGVPAAPQPPPGLTSLVAVATGWDHSLALRADGTVVAWGDNRRLQLWIPQGLTNVVAIAAGGYANFALRADGTVVTWGGGSSGVLTGLTNVVAIDAGGHVLALRADTTVVAWGGNFHGQSSVPEGLSNVVDMAAGGSHSLALRSDDAIVGWGRSYEGQTTPPAGLSNVVAITAGAYHSLALIGHGPPSLRAPLVDRSIPLNGTVYFRMTASGARPLHYQWLHDGVILPGATNPVLALTNVQFAQEGAYSVTVSNALGRVSSREAVLTVIPPEGHVLVGSLRWTNGQFQFTATSATGLVWTVQVSSDLTTWTDLVTLTNLTGTVPFTDSGANLSRRFYRLRLGP